MKKEFIGEGALGNIQKILDFVKAKRIFLVTGKKSFSLSGAQRSISRLLENKEVVIFNDFHSTPDLKDVKRGVHLLKDSCSDLIVAIGGGGVLDMAKLVNILANQNKLNSINFIKNSNLISNKGIPLVAVPTTAGSGSQATHFAVVYIESCKYSLAHDYLLPDYVIVDPALCYSASKKVAGSSAMDALSQAIESYWSLRATSESQGYATDAIKLILDSIDLAINQKDRDSIGAMSLASHLSGKAINITKTTAPHAISYILTSNFGIPHGHAVSLLLIPVIYVSVESGNHEYKRTLDEIFELFNCKSLDEFKDIWVDLMKKCGLSLRLEEFNVTMKSLNFIVKNVNVERLQGHPVKLNKLDLECIVRMAVAGN